MRKISLMHTIILSVFLFLSIGNATQLDIQELMIGKAAYRMECELDAKGRLRPKEDGLAFSRVKDLRNQKPFNGFFEEGNQRIQNDYMFFSSEQAHPRTLRRNNPVRGYNYSAFRLDIEGETVVKNKKYIRLQLQNHSGQNNSYASLLAPTDIPIHVNLVYFALNISCAIHFNKTAEEMKDYPDGEATAAIKTILLDDPIFTSRKECIHIRKKHEDIKEALALGMSLKEYKHAKAAQELKERQKRQAITNRKNPRHQPWVARTETPE